jgi:hypothetical protein
MRISKERKIYAVLVGVAAVGLGAVFFNLAPGAPAAEAAAGTVDAQSKPVADPSTSALDSGNTNFLSLASKLKSFGTSYKISGRVDAFKPGSAWLVAKPAANIAVAARAVDAFKGAHQLSAVLVAGWSSHAIVDGRTFAIGQSLDGYKLVAITPKTAVFQANATKVVLRVPLPDQIAVIDAR